MNIGSFNRRISICDQRCIILSIGALYEHREAVANGTIAELPRSHVDGLLDPYRVIE